MIIGIQYKNVSVGFPRERGVIVARTEHLHRLYVFL